MRKKILLNSPIILLIYQDDNEYPLNIILGLIGLYPL